jgi:hypothetical protein
MLLMVLVIEFAAVPLISFFGGGRNPNHTTWVVVCCYLPVGLPVVVAVQAG